MLVQFKGIRDHFIRELGIYRHFFEKNVTGYTYLFFAQTSFLAYISPIEWSNVILYGEYKLNRDLVR